MAQKLSGKRLGREQISGMLIITCLGILLTTVMIIHFLDVKVVNIDQVDKGLYTIVTDQGPVNITPAEILRIERTYAKTALTGQPVELDRIYTDKGFIYVSSLDSFASLAQEMINKVDFTGQDVWERSQTSWKTVQPYAYAIGTPEKRIPWLFLLLTVQYWAMSVGGIALAVLIFPLRWNDKAQDTGQVSTQPEQEYRSSSSSKEEKQLGAIAK